MLFVLQNIINEFGETKAKQLFSSFINGNDKYCEYFKKLIELDEEPDTKADIVFKNGKMLECKVENFPDRIELSSSSITLK